MLVIMSGVSGVGKNTIIRELIKQFKNMQFFHSVTTRPVRDGEDIYINMTAEEFADAEKKGKFFETAEVHGYMYGTLNETLDKIIKNKNKIYIKDIDVYGNQAFRKHLDGKAKVLSIFLDAPNEVLYERLINRGESEERAKTRISRGEMERQHKHEYDLLIENIDMERTIKVIKDRLKKEGFVC